MGKTLSLTPGFRFHPTDVELVKFYLKRKVLGKTFSVEAVTELDIYKYDPWDLPGKSCLKSRDLKWYFFCPRERKYSSGTRIKRATEFGYWKTTGKDRAVKYNGEVAGMIKTLIFHRGKAPNGDRTNWVMHEYRLEDKNLSDIKDSYVLCMIFEKNGPGPRNGAQYGAPYNEEEWTDGEEEEEEVTVAGVSAVPSFSVPETGQVASTSQISPSKDLARSSLIGSCVSEAAGPSSELPRKGQVASTSQISPSKDLLGSSLFGPCVSEVAGPSSKLPRNNDVEAQMLPALDENDILSSLYDSMMDESNEALNYTNQLNEGFVCPPRSDGADVFEGLDDLGNLAGLGEEGFGGYNDGYYLELRDLCTPLTSPSGNKEDQDQFPTPFNGCPDPGKSSYCQANDVSVWSDWNCGLEDRDQVDPCASAAQNRAQSSAADINYGYQIQGLHGWKRPSEKDR